MPAASCTRVLALLLVAGTASASSCPDIPSLRSPYVQQHFDASGLLGLWYEQAYIDVAQVGASCPTLNGTFKADGTLDMAFKVDYGKMPFTIQEEYHATNTTGYYIKEADMPGAGFLKLPTAVVDVTLQQSGGRYDTMILFSCTTKLGIEIPELVFASRSPTMDSSDLEKLQAAAKAQGVQWDAQKLKVVNRTAEHCQ